MDSQHNRGRPRLPDSILMSIKAIVMEALYHPRYKSPDVQELLRRILSCYGHGDKFTQRIYVEKLKEIEQMLHKAGER